MRIYRLLLILLVSLALGITAIGCGGKPASTTPASEPEKQVQEEEKEEGSTAIEGEELNVQEPQTVDPNKEYHAILETSLGKIKIKFFPKEAPKTVTNFIQLTNKNFYSGTIFHRIIPDFMIQGGDPEGTGMGGPGYVFEDEINAHKLVRGTLAMANRGPDTNGSQFFIVTAQSTPWLDGKHTAFGEVVEGMDVVDKISATKTDANDKPVEPIELVKVVIEEK